MSHQCFPPPSHQPWISTLVPSETECMTPAVPFLISMPNGGLSVPLWFETFVLLSSVVKLQDVLPPSSFAATSWHVEELRHQVNFKTHCHQQEEETPLKTFSAFQRMCALMTFAHYLNIPATSEETQSPCSQTCMSTLHEACHMPFNIICRHKQ